MAGDATGITADVLAAFVEAKLGRKLSGDQSAAMAQKISDLECEAGEGGEPGDAKVNFEQMAQIEACVFPDTVEFPVAALEPMKAFQSPLLAKVVAMLCDSDADVAALQRLLTPAALLPAADHLITHAVGTVRARPGRLSGLSVPYCFAQKIGFVWRFCMGAQGA
jgi:hypothetical protein